jgi:hypothetical protein
MMRLGEDDRWRAVGVLSARIWLDQSRAASGCAYAYVSITTAEKIVLRVWCACVITAVETIVLRGSGRVRLSSQPRKRPTEGGCGESQRLRRARIESI